ncbi:MAG TPA: amidase family protein, partial [Chitinophagales bacterium]|nr:amidase family protein [Chitinophagales bacterium]
CGTFTTNAYDAAAILEVIAGQDANDSTTSEAAVPAYSAKLECTRKLKIAYYPQALQNEKVDSEIRKNILSLIKKLQSHGHIVEPVDFNYLDYLVPTYYVLTTAEASSNLSRYSGINYGYRTEDAATLEDVLRKSRSEGFGKEVKRRIMLGTFVLSSGYYDAYYTHAQKVRRKIKDETDNILKTYDCILLPTTPTTAFALNEIADPIEMYLADIFTVQANITGLPAVSVPLFRHSKGLPFGVQIMGKRFAEDTLLSVTNMLMHDY